MIALLNLTLTRCMPAGVLQAAHETCMFLAVPCHALVTALCGHAYTAVVFTAFGKADTIFKTAAEQTLAGDGKDLC